MKIGGGGEDDDFCSYLEITDNTAAGESCHLNRSIFHLLCYVSAEIAGLKLNFTMYKTSP